MTLLAALASLTFTPPSHAEFVRGIFTGRVETYDTIVGMGFNLAIGYMEAEEVAASRRLKLKMIPLWYGDDTRSMLRMKSGDTDGLIAAWFPYDEPDLYGHPKAAVAEKIGRLRRYSRKPVFLTVWSPLQYNTYFPLADICGITPYPIGRSEAETRMEIPGVYTRIARTAARNKKLYVFVPAFYQKPWWPRPPDPDELHNIVYQVLTGSPDGILYFAWTIGSQDGSVWKLSDRPDLMAEMMKVNAELKAMDAILTRGKNSFEIKAAYPQSVFYRLIEFGRKKHLIIASPLKEETTFSATFGRRMGRPSITFGGNAELVAAPGDRNVSVKLGRYGYALVQFE